ncbi:histidine-rich glycoprotein-like [Venturia canescens]|uniref:histidine-rich glycoprotein-like n=1 Tax=Venturia canescens TaxID=32260 RepID=UPI001C9D13D7|nr:histidine-rich glycoprotein-like [Venturia canescens]
MEGGKPARRTNSDKVDGDDYRSESRSAPASPSLSQVPQFNPQNTLIAPVKPPSRAHRTVPRIINGYVANDYKLSSPISSIENREVGGSDRRNSGKVPAYDFYDAYKSINSSPVAPRPTLVPENSDHYGSRVIPLKDSERQNPSPAASPQTHQIRSIDSSIDRTRLPRIPVRNHAEPAESVQQASSLVDARDYEDEVPASSGHEENHETHADSKKDEGTEEESEKGGGEKHEEAHHNSSGEKAEKEYKEWHEYDKAKKGHHDKEHHDNEYHEEKGGKKKHEEESGYHKEHHRGEKGSKESEFAEKGKHEKGHSTKGEHVVHKKDEYEKKTEFYDESHEEDGDEKEGEYHHEHEEKKGGHEKIGHHDSAHRIDKYGEKGEHEKGHHWHETKGHEKKDGREEEHSHEEKYGKKGGHEEGEKWSHNNGDKGQR